MVKVFGVGTRDLDSKPGCIGLVSCASGSVQEKEKILYASTENNGSWRFLLDVKSFISSEIDDAHYWVAATKKSKVLTLSWFVEIKSSCYGSFGFCSA